MFFLQFLPSLRFSANLILSPLPPSCLLACRESQLFDSFSFYAFVVVALLSLLTSAICGTRMPQLLLVGFATNGFFSCCRWYEYLSLSCHIFRMCHYVKSMCKICSPQGVLVLFWHYNVIGCLTYLLLLQWKILHLTSCNQVFNCYWLARHYRYFLFCLTNCIQQMVEMELVEIENSSKIRENMISVVENSWKGRFSTEVHMVCSFKV